MEEPARSTTERARIVSARQSCSSDACAHGGGWSELREESNAARAGWRARHGLCAPCSDEWVEGQVQMQTATRRSCARYAAHDSAAAAAPRSAFRARCGWPGRILSSAGRDLEVWALGRAWPGHTEHLAALARRLLMAHVVCSPWKTRKLPFGREMDLEAVLKSAHRGHLISTCLLYTSPSPRDRTRSRMPSSA